MASTRVLRTVGAIAIASLLATGCAVWPIWAWRVEGRVIDEETGKGIAGAEVFYHWSMMGAVPLSGGSDFGYRWVTTDADGHFVIRGHVESQPWAILYFTELRPHLEVLDPRYGRFAFGYADEPPESWRRLELRLRRDEHRLEWLRNPRNAYDLCSGLGPGCRRACEVWWGEVGPCIDPGGLTSLREKGAR